MLYAKRIMQYLIGVVQYKIMKTWLASIVLVYGVLSQTERIANFPLIQTTSTYAGVKTGEHKAVMAPLITGASTSLQQPFFVTYPSAPIVAIGLLTFQIDTQSVNMNYTVTISAITTVGFTSTIKAGTDTKINQLKYTYLALPSDFSFGHLQPIDFSGFTSIASTSSSLRMYTKSFTITPSTFDSTHNYIISVFIKDFVLIKQNNDFSIKITATQLMPNEIPIKIQSNCTVTAASFFLFWIDESQLEANQTFFIDPGYVVGENNKTQFYEFGFPTSIINYYNFMAGANWLAFNTSNQTIFSVRFNSYPIYTLRQYKFAYANLVHWRKRDCVDLSLLYLQEHLKCYQICPERYANNTAQTYCKKCDYSCLNCLADGTCTQCSANSITHRSLSNGKCPCDNKYFDVAGVESCSACHYSCSTCEINSTNCLTCHSTRDRNPTTHACTCKLRLYDPGNSQICDNCHYTCQTCSSNTANSCLTCDSSKFRVKVLNSCLCQNGYQETSGSQVELCVQVPNLVCSLNCFTCNGTAGVCTGCDQNKRRVLANQKCQCYAGYTSPSDFQPCTEICGDGKVYESQCDDGNTLSGDGCSSTCTKQADFSCDSSQPTICVYNLPYTIVLKSINKRPTQNLIDLQFQIVPPPPAGSKASLDNLPIVIISQNIDAGSLKMVAEYVQSIPLGKLAKLSLSTIPNILEFQVKSQNGLALNYYSTTNYSLFNAQVGLVWLYVALVWLGAIIFLSVCHNSLLAVTQFMMSVGLTWVGVGTLSRYFLYYEPLTYLKYIFGYNAVISGEDGMFAYANYGFLFSLIPLLLFFILLSLRRVHRFFIMDQFVKKFLLAQITFAFLCFNSIIVIYGLASEQISKTRSTALSITSIIFGIIYLLLVAGGSAYFVLKSQSFHYFKDRMFTPKGPQFWVSVMLWGKIITVLAYTLYSFNYRSSQYPPLIVACASIFNIVVTVIVRPYLNNVRLILNQIVTIVVFMAYFLMLQVSSAEWTGFAILMLLYLQMIMNYAMIGTQWYKERSDRFIQNSEYTESKQGNFGDQLRESGQKQYNIDMDFDPRLVATEVKRPQISFEDDRRMDTVKRYSNAQDLDNIQNPYADQFSSVRKRMIHQPQAN